ncbi:hypothetical protein CFD26_107265 [Aspergillus turcosus]|uniref:Zn(2)-C6 fungal-type domain-containing protein n=1 Tax=Aspergillus turcosus TaxID=1245748 RepID=A0A3R7F7Q2_9EURO|nr:hypothetical protein CFD26_107265 [Aspergillus turcosus]
MAQNSMRSRTGCYTCRQRHVKCDEEKPICWRCRIGGRNCERPDYAEAQRSRPRPQRRRATTSENVLQPTHDSTHRRQSIAFNELAPVTASAVPTLSSPTSSASRGISIRSLTTQHPHNVDAHASLAAPLTTTPPSAPDVESSNANVAFDLHTLQGIRLYLNHADIRADSPDGYSSGSTFTVSAEEEFLIQHYARRISKWVLYSDADRHFSITVPHLARRSPILCRAVSALAARHLSCTGNYDSSVADDYHKQCIELLIPALNEPNAAADDKLLAALVLLRLYEQVNVSYSGKDYEHHLSGVSAMVTSTIRNPWTASGSGLKWAAFWCCFRQSVYPACLHRQPLKFDISGYKIEVNLSTPAPGVMATVEEESEWCHWITWILAQVVDFCFGTRSRDMTMLEEGQAWKGLLQAVEMWEANKPKSFLPVACNERNPELGGWFPEILFGSEWHAMATTQSLAARILLDVYNPETRRISIGEFGFLRARERLESKVLLHARSLCGICLANPANIGAIFTLCHTIFAFSSFISVDEERKLLVQVLRIAERDDGWPTSWIVNALKADWNVDWVDE